MEVGGKLFFVVGYSNEISVFLVADVLGWWDLFVSRCSGVLREKRFDIKIKIKTAFKLFFFLSGVTCLVFF